MVVNNNTSKSGVGGFLYSICTGKMCKLINSFESVCLCRYNRNLPDSQNFGSTQMHMQNFQSPPYLHYDTALPQFGHMPDTQASPSYCYSSFVQIPYYASRPYQSSMDAVYVQVPSPAMMYPQSYDQLRNAVLQVVFSFIN